MVQESAAADLVNASEAAEVVNFLSGQWNFIKKVFEMKPVLHCSGKLY